MATDVPATTCPKCKDARHVPGKNGGWVRCSCVVRRVREIEYLAAGVPEVHLPGETIDYAAAWGKTIPSAFLPPDSGVLIWLRGPMTGLRRGRCVSHFLRAAVDQGLTAASTNLREAIDARFDREAGPDWRRVLEESRALVVDMDATAHKFLPDVAAEVWGRRAGMRARTLFVSSIDIPKATGLYGPTVCAEFASARVLRLSTLGRSAP